LNGKGDGIGGLPTEEATSVLSEESAGTGILDSQVTRDLMNELVRIRKKRKIGQEPIAKAIGITQGRVSQLENLKGNMTLEALLLYAQTIGAEIVVVPIKDRKGPKD